MARDWPATQEVIRVLRMATDAKVGRDANAALAEAHAAYRIVFCDGTVVYVDNGGFGGIFYSEDIPGNAEEDFPPDAPPGVR